MHLHQFEYGEFWEGDQKIGMPDIAAATRTVRRRDAVQVNRGHVQVINYGRWPE